MAYPKLIQDVIQQLSQLPGVGPRSAERMVFWFLNQPKEQVMEFAHSITALKEGLMFCKRCHSLSDQEVCPICLDQARDHSIICVVENPKDLIAIERSGSYKGAYHVLLGTISPSDGKGPDDITAPQLLERAKQEHVKEIVIATDPDNEGEMTALYLIKQLQPIDVKVSRIGVGLPMGGAVEYADISTLSMSLTARREVTQSLE